MSPQPSAEATEEKPCAQARSPADAGIDFGNPDPNARMLRNFSHRCRNSLSAIKLGLYLLKKQGECTTPPRCNELWRQYEEIENLFDRLQRISQTSSLTVVRSPLGQLFAERLPLWRSRFGEFGRSILVDPPEQDIAGDFDPTHLGLGLDSFIAWRSQSAQAHSPRLGWRVARGQFEISWTEARAEGSNGNARASSCLPEPQSADASTSLALLLLARVAADHGGEVEASRGQPLDVTIRWPQFRDEITRR
jgi:hypothetical protein